MARHGRSLIMYRVFNWDYDSGDDHYEYYRDAIKAYRKAVKDDEGGNWRLYRDTETPEGSGNFKEDCLETAERGGTDTQPKEQKMITYAAKDLRAERSELQRQQWLCVTEEGIVITHKRYEYQELQKKINELTIAITVLDRL